MSQILTVTVWWKDPIMLTFQDHTADNLQLNWTVPLLFLIIYLFFLFFFGSQAPVNNKNRDNSHPKPNSFS